jgi:hypothetical protein
MILERISRRSISKQLHDAYQATALHVHKCNLNNMRTTISTSAQAQQDDRNTTLSPG